MVGPSTVDATPSPTIKFLCSYGGRIIPRQLDGELRYLGGHTRILAVRRSVPFSELLLKLGEFCGTKVHVRCQLPTEDLDALVSITCDEDLANIIEEYDRLSSQPCPLKIRAFLSPPKSLRKSTTNNTAIPTSISPRLLSSASSKSSTSTSSSSSSSRTLSAASVAAVASCCSTCSHRYAMMPMMDDCCIRRRVFPQSFPTGLEKPKGKISDHHPVPRPQCCYRDQRHVNTPRFYLIHNGYQWQ